MVIHSSGFNYKLDYFSFLSLNLFCNGVCIVKNYKYMIVNLATGEIVTGSQHLANARRKLESNPGCVLQYSEAAMLEYQAEQFEKSSYLGASNER